MPASPLTAPTARFDSAFQFSPRGSRTIWKTWHYGLKTIACPKCEVPTHELGTNAKNYRSRDYATYQRYKPENANSGSESDNDHVMSDNLGIGQNRFHRLDRVSVSNLYKPDMLHTIYLGLFKHMMDWIEGFLKKHGRLQAFNDVTGLFLSNDNTIGPAIDVLALVLREASRDR